MVEFGLDLGYSAVFMFLAEKQVLHLSHLLIAPLYFFGAQLASNQIAFAFLNIKFALEPLALELCLDLLLHFGLGMGYIGSYLVERVEAHSTSLSNHIACSEIQVVSLSVMFDLRDPLGHVLLHLRVVLRTLYLEPLPA